MKHEGREWHRWACVSSIYHHDPPCYSQVLNPAFYDGNNPNDTIMFLGASVPRAGLEDNMPRLEGVLPSGIARQLLPDPKPWDHGRWG